MSNQLVSNVNAAIEDTISSCTWINAVDLLPSPLTDLDVANVLTRCSAIKKPGFGEILCLTCVLSKGFICSSIALFESTLMRLAASLAPSVSMVLDDDNDRKSKKRDKTRVRAADIVPPELSIMAIAAALTAHVGECDNKLRVELATLITRPLLTRLEELQRSIFVAGGEGGERRRNRDENSEKFRDLYITARLCEKGFKVFEDDAAMHKFILRSLGLDLLYLVFQIQAVDQNVTLPTGVMMENVAAAGNV